MDPLPSISSHPFDRLRRIYLEGKLFSTIKTRLQHRYYGCVSLARRGRIRSYLRRRTLIGARYTAFPQLMLALQSFNKDFLLHRSLQPFLNGNLRHLVVFADGCTDNTAQKAHHLLSGPDHLVIICNDRHEVRNNRLALELARHQDCSFLLLLQDDDLYPEDLHWLEQGLALFDRYPRLLVLGFNIGLDFLSFEHASDNYLELPLRSRLDVHPNAVGVDGAFLAIRYGLPPHPLEPKFRFCQAVYRAPLLIRVGPFTEHVGIDPRFAPFQDDDTFFCLKAWSSGWQCGLLAGVPIKRDMGIGGMRLMGHIGARRAAHTLDNIRLIHEVYGDSIINGSIAKLVDEANSSRLY